MELNHLKAFHEVAKAGSFTEAARRLHVSQSALSKAVALLEDREGVKLLARSKRGVQLTKTGQVVFEQAERLFQIAAEIELTCRGVKEVCEGPLRFGASDHVMNYLLLDKVAALRSAHPRVRPGLITGTPNELVELLLRDEIEFAMFFTRINVPGVRYEVIREVPMAIVCHPKLARGGRAGARELARERGLIGSVRTQYQHDPSRELVKALRDEAAPTFEANNQETQKRLCLHGEGVAFLARFMVEEEIASGALAELRPRKPLSMPLHLAVRKGRELSLNARTFLAL